ncbi:MAG TPA: aminodeoxychorismate synthase component I, partial [Rhodocyclaceae bacterium]|nr:aminodeoxychorismate synthase component I [Rhodocyclaceae bacterium]
MSHLSTSASASASDSFALFEDNLSDPPRARLLSGLREHICLTRVEDVVVLFDKLAALQSEGCWIALAAHYELGYVLEPKLSSLLKDRDVEAPLLQAWAYEQMTPLHGTTLQQWWDAELSALSPQEREAGLLSLTPSIEHAHYVDLVHRALNYIREGDCYQINLTFPMRGQFFGDPLALFERLREAQPVHYGALIRNNDKWILSRSPELFVARRNMQLECKPMKGTALRHTDAARDAEQATALRGSAKDCAENLMIVDLIRNDLGRLSPAGGVQVTQLFELETYRTIHQLTSTVLAEPVTATLLQVLRALFPCGSITGAPKIRAMQIIRELERNARGLYCGALGWIAPNGDYTLNVPIRTLHTAPGGSCRMDIGSGIVADSIAGNEYAECLSKARFATAICEEFQLIETMRFDAGDVPFALLEGHIARLARSAKELVFNFDEKKAREQIDRFASQLEPHTQRVRLLLARNGDISLNAAALNEMSGIPTVNLGSYLLDPNDLRLRH